MEIKFFHKIKENISSFIRKYTPEPIEIPIEIIPEIQTYSIEKYYTDSFSVETLTKSFVPTKLSNNELTVLKRKLFSGENFYLDGKAEILLKIYQDCAKIHDALIPLVKMGVYYSVDLIGGAARDFLLNKEIKDLDILIRVDSPFKKDIPWKLLRIYKETLIKKGLCTEEELQTVQYSDADPIYTQQTKLVQLCLNRQSYEISPSIFLEEERTLMKVLYGPNVLKKLSGMLKIKSDELHYPVEVLITDQDKYRITCSADFGLCSLGVSLMDLHVNEHIMFPSIDKFRERFYCAEEFFDDIRNKTLTYNTYESDHEQIQHSFVNRLPRIAQKYPDYTLKISPNQTDDETKQLLEKYLLSYTLSRTLTSETPKTRHKKNKI